MMVTLEITLRSICVATVPAHCVRDMARKEILSLSPGPSYRRSAESVTTLSNSGGTTVTARAFTPTTI